MSELDTLHNGAGATGGPARRDCPSQNLHYFLTDQKPPSDHKHDSHSVMVITLGNQYGGLVVLT